MARAPSLVQQIPLATELSREGHVGGAIAPPPSDGTGEAAQALARDFSAVGAQIGALADHAAQVEGTRQGHLAGIDPEWRARNDFTIRGEAFDRAGRETALARTRVGIHNDIEQAALRHQADPQGLTKELNSKVNGWIEGADPSLAPEIRNLFSAGTLAAAREATRQMWSRQAAEQQGALQAELDRTLRSVHQMAFAAGLDPAADQAVADQVARMEGALSRKGPNGAPLVAPAAAVKLLANAKEEVSTARLYGAFDRLPDLGAKQAFVKQLDTDFAGSSGLASAFDLPTFQKVKGHLESELRRAEAKGRQIDAATVHAVGEVERRAKNGEPVAPAELASLQAKVVTAGNADLYEKFADGVDNLAFMQAFKTLPVTEMRATLDKMRGELATSPAGLGDRGRAGKNLKAAEEMLSTAEAQVKAAPLAWDNRVGMANVTRLADVDLNQPGAATAWGGARVAQAEESARRHALAKPVYLLPDEERRLAKSFEQGGAAGLQAVAFVRQAFGAKAEAVLGELGKGAPAGALIGDLVLRAPGGQPPPAALDAAEGLHLRTQSGYKPLAPEESKTRPYASEVVGTGLANGPAYLSAAMRTADAIYETRANREGKRDAFAPEIWKQALKEALGETRGGDGRSYGGVVSIGGLGGWGGTKLVIPPSIAQDKAASTFAAITPDDLGGGLGAGPKFANGRALTAQELRGASYMTVAPGKYLVRVGGSGGGWARGDDGKPYVLDIEAALPSIRQRRPDLR